MPREPLPIDDALPDLLAAMRTRGAVVLRAPTGAGKTTRVPPALVESGLASDGLVIMLEPRRVAARAAARRMAIEHGSPLGDVFGYQVRFDRKAGPRTRVLVVTPGVLLRRLHDDAFLEGVACVVFDEFHERSLEADLALGLVRLIRETVRPELQVIVMSATVDPAAISAYLGGCPVVDSAGRAFPVDVKYRPRRSDIGVSFAVADAVREVLTETSGDVLAFLPGLREIRQAADELERDAREHGFEVLPLHGDLPPEQQDRALQKLPHRKVVLATNVAETSVTVDGVTAVVDSGLARQMEFEPGIGMDRLKLGPISRASADQRAGRAGRTQPGVCVRLWDEPSHRGRPEQTIPEIRRVDLCGAVLQLFALGESDVERFPWLDAPRSDSLAESLRLLEQLGIVANGSLTDIGRDAAALPVHPRLARLLIEGQRLGCGQRAALAAALLSERDPFLREFDSGPYVRTAPPTVSDVLDRVEALEAFDATGRLDGPLGRLHRGGARAVLDVRDQLKRLLTPTARQDQDSSLLRCIFAAYPDRLARRREPGSSKAVTITGRGVKLAPSSGVSEPELFVCVDVDAGGTDSFVRLASGVERDWLPADRVSTQIEVMFDERTEKLIAKKLTRFDELVLSETPAHIGDDNEAARILAESAAKHFAQCLPTPESEAGRFRTRVRCLRAWVPELNLPAFDAADLREALEFFCRGQRSLADVRHGPWLDFLRNQLTYDQLRTIDAEVPDTIEVPSGSHISIEYTEGRTPILAARIQEMFGLTETPRIARGRVKVLLHLLAPNHRPQQVTDDLASFWANGYPLVRKELRGRYPKHSWPEDPLTAEAICGVRRKPS
ncbi:MAG: ATP-dependent helicase HrpB [Planctomycetes bacterium]|nr:ATP-dependent helicase HrpB [Planctomycetota bacterium]